MFSLLFSGRFQFFKTVKMCLLSYFEKRIFENNEKFYKENSKQQKIILTVFITNAKMLQIKRTHFQQSQNRHSKYKTKNEFKTQNRKLKHEENNP